MMRGKFKIGAVFVFLTGCWWGLCSQNKTDNLVIVQDLVNIIKEDNDTLKEVPDDLLSIVENYYTEKNNKENQIKKEQKKSEKPVNKVKETDVLSYITSAFSEHGYNDLGSWVPPQSTGKSNSYSNFYKSRTSHYKLPQNYQYPAYNASDFLMPFNGAYSSFFGYRPQFGRFHKGIDISLKVGDTVRCSLPGVVVRIKNDPDGYGNYVVVSHDGDLETLYAHLTRELVVTGQLLNAGDAVGLGGNTGNATGPHLHFETRIKGEAIDPLYYLPRKSVRK